MIKTTVNRDDIKNVHPPVQDLGALIQALEKEYLKKGQLICQFKLNGMVLTEADEHRLSQIQLSEVDIIEIESETPVALLFGLLSNWITELPVLMTNIDELAKEIKFKGVEGNLKPFVDLIDSCQFLMESLQSLANIIKG